MKCDIIIPIWDQLQFTSECIKSIITNTKFPFRLILIDNGSRKDMQDYLAALAVKSDEQAVLSRHLSTMMKCQLYTAYIDQYLTAHSSALKELRESFSEMPKRIPLPRPIKEKPQTEEFHKNDSTKE